MNRLVSGNSLTVNEGVEHRIRRAQEQEEPSASHQVTGVHDEVPTTSVQAQTIQELEARIAFLEKELIETRLQLANTRESEECLKLEVSKLRRSSKANVGSSSPHCSPEEDYLLSAGDENRCVVVSTDDPFSHNSSSKKYTSSDKKQVHKARRTSAKTSLNPGSCSSALDLLAMADLSPSMQSNASMSSLLGLQRPQRGGGGGGSRRNLLNPDSCSSGLNLLLNPNSCASGLNLLIDPQGHDLLRGNMNGSSGSGLSLSGLLGNARLLSNSSLNRRNGIGGSSRNNMSRLNRTMQASNSNRNEEWDVFE